MRTIAKGGATDTEGGLKAERTKDNTEKAKPNQYKQKKKTKIL